MKQSSAKVRTADIVQPIVLSDVGAVRAFDNLSPAAATLLMGVIRVTSRSGGNEAVIAQAALSMNMKRKITLRVFNELRRVGLLRGRRDGSLLLYRMISSYSHELARRKRCDRGDVGHVVKLSRETA